MDVHLPVGSLKCVIRKGNLQAVERQAGLMSLASHPFFTPRYNTVPKRLVYCVGADKLSRPIETKENVLFFQEG
jgi:hypothetical protein